MVFLLFMWTGIKNKKSFRWETKCCRFVVMSVYQLSDSQIIQRRCCNSLKIWLCGENFDNKTKQKSQFLCFQPKLLLYQHCCCGSVRVCHEPRFHIHNPVCWSLDFLEHLGTFSSYHNFVLVLEPQCQELEKESDWTSLKEERSPVDVCLFSSSEDYLTLE